MPVSRITPSVGSKGRYTLSLPWTANAAKLYECEAIRSFDDIYELGVDVYQEYYVPMGLLDNTVVSGNLFLFKEQRDANVCIITLRSTDDGEYIYVPDSYIANSPNGNVKPYSHIVLSVNCGPLPDYLDLSALKSDLSDMAKGYLGITTPGSLVLENRAASTNQPTALEADALETARTAAVTIKKSFQQLYLEEVAKNQRNTQIIAALTQKLIDAGVFPP